LVNPRGDVQGGSRSKERQSCADRAENKIMLAFTQFEGLSASMLAFLGRVDGHTKGHLTFRFV
jgi:hypothetical protein